jgi:probable F420-dependent oxidoreductase
MKWGLLSAMSGPFVQPELAEALVVAAEDAGFESVWGGEHTVMPVTYRSAYPFSDSGRYRPLGRSDAPATGDETPWSDLLTWFAFASALTTTLRFGSGVVVLPQRNPIHLAKQAATADVLSRGRIMLGVGVGWLREEFDALGAEWEERGQRTEEYIALMRALWRDREASFHGEFVDFDPVYLVPKPVQPGGVPIHVAGHGAVAARRAGRIGDGYFPAIYPNSRVHELLPVLIDEMRRSAAGAGRDPMTVEVTSGGARTVEAAKWYEDLGVDRLLIKVRAIEPAPLREELLRFGDEVIGRTPGSR